MHKVGSEALHLPGWGGLGGGPRGAGRCSGAMMARRPSSPSGPCSISGVSAVGTTWKVTTAVSLSPRPLSCRRKRPGGGRGRGCALEERATAGAGQFPAGGWCRNAAWACPWPAAMWPGYVCQQAGTPPTVVPEEAQPGAVGGRKYGDTCNWLWDVGARALHLNSRLPSRQTALSGRP